MGIPFLSKPIDIYKKSYLEALDEFQKEGINLKYDKSELNKDFNKFIDELNMLETNPKLESGRVKEIIFWLIDENEFIGRISIRPQLSPYLQRYDGNVGFEIRPCKRKMGYGYTILKLGLKEVKSLGMDIAFIMCRDDNRASIKIIESTKSVLLERYKLLIEGKTVLVRKYAIMLKNFSFSK